MPSLSLSPYAMQLCVCAFVLYLRWDLRLKNPTPYYYFSLILFDFVQWSMLMQVKASQLMTQYFKDVKNHFLAFMSWINLQTSIIIICVNDQIIRLNPNWFYKFWSRFRNIKKYLFPSIVKILHRNSPMFIINHFLFALKESTMPWIPSGSAATTPSSFQRATAPSPSPYKPSRIGSKQLQSGSNWLILDLMSTLIQWSCGTLCHTVVQARLVFSFTKLYKQTQQKCSQNAAK